MQQLILTNNKDYNLKEILIEFADRADKIRVASAFFSDVDFINNWLDSTKQIDLLISLRPPTNYYSLKNVYSKIGINIQFLGDDFHSKFFIFYDKRQPFACIIGSSNFTAGGLYKNIETNAIFTDLTYLKEIDKHFLMLWEQSFTLQPTDLDNFKTVFDNYQKRIEQTEKEQANLQKKILTNRNNKKKSPRINKEAKQYLTFWTIVNEIKEIVGEISIREYPNVPLYISIDHFWHWVKVVWAKENSPKPKINDQNIIIPKLFKEYCQWDKSSSNDTKKMAKISKSIFARLLSESNIDKLSKDDAKLIYANLHSGAMRTRRFGADEKFTEENSIHRIRQSLKYLLYSKDDITLRIHNLCFNPDFKLKQLKSSGTQELIGWVMPNNYPIRNDKADEALKLLGYELD